MKIYSIKEFAEYVHECDCKELTRPGHTIPKRKYSVTKSKQKTKAVKITEYDKNFVPYEVTLQTAHNTTVYDTNGITRLILDYLRYVYNSSSVRRISSEGKFRKGIGFIPSSNKGMSDIEGVVNGKFLSLELKIGKDLIRESQLKRKAQIESDGGIYYLCRWIDFEQLQIDLQILLPLK